MRHLLVEIQHQLFNLGGELSIPGFELLKAEAVLALDDALAEHNAALPRLQEFILPAGTRAASLSHVSRTIAPVSYTHLDVYKRQPQARPGPSTCPCRGTC